MASKHRIRVVGGLESASIYGIDSNKGNALRVFDQLAQYFFPDLEGARGTTAVAFGNGANDLAMFEVVQVNGGKAILVGNDLLESQMPKYVVKAQRPNGEGIFESIEIVEKWLTNGPDSQSFVNSAK